jgi:hypothetical protein
MLENASIIEILTLGTLLYCVVLLMSILSVIKKDKDMLNALCEACSISNFIRKQFKRFKK